MDALLYNKRDSVKYINALCLLPIFIYNVFATSLRSVCCVRPCVSARERLYTCACELCTDVVVSFSNNRLSYLIISSQPRALSAACISYLVSRASDYALLHAGLYDNVECEDSECPIREGDGPLSTARVDVAAVDEEKPEEDGHD